MITEQATSRRCNDMSSKLVNMLKKKRDDAREAFLKAKEQRDEADEALHGALGGFVTWQDALDAALKDAGLPPEDRAEIKKMYATTPRGRSIREVAAEMLEQIGPLSSAQIRDLLATAGRETTTNTVTVTLNKHKDVFERNEDGLWALKEKGEQ